MLLSILLWILLSRKNLNSCRLINFRLFPFSTTFSLGHAAASFTKASNNNAISFTRGLTFGGLVVGLICGTGICLVCEEPTRLVWRESRRLAEQIIVHFILSMQRANAWIEQKPFAVEALNEIVAFSGKILERICQLPRL